jgi:hypothetical protein
MREDFHKIVGTIAVHGTKISFLHKQLKRMRSEQQDEWEGYFDQYYSYCNATHRRITDASVETFETIIQYLIDNDITGALNEYQTSSIDHIIEIKNHLLWYSSLTVDLYFLSRTFKTTNDGKNPIISIGYFGYAHTDKIKYFLTHIMKNYTEVIDTTRSAEQRCIEIKNHVDLDVMISKLTTQ